MRNTERCAKSERIAVVDGKVVHGVLAVVGVVVASQQTIKLRVDVHVVMQAANPGLRHAGRTPTQGTADGPLLGTARVLVKARQAETVATLQDFRTNAKSVVAQTATQKLLVRLLRLVFPAMVLFLHVRIGHRRHSVPLSFNWRQLCRFTVYYCRKKSFLISNNRCNCQA